MYQKLMIVGRLGKDPEMRYTPAGQPVTTFSVATDRQYTDQAGKLVKETVWFRVQTWGKLAEICSNFLQKGKLVMAEGRLTVDPKTGGPRIWKGQDDLMHANLEMTASLVKFLSPNSAQTNGEVQYDDSDPTTPDVEDIPF